MSEGEGEVGTGQGQETGQVRPPEGRQEKCQAAEDASDDGDGDDGAVPPWIESRDQIKGGQHHEEDGQEPQIERFSGKRKVEEAARDLWRSHHEQGESEVVEGAYDEAASQQPQEEKALIREFAAGHGYEEYQAYWAFRTR